MESHCKILQTITQRDNRKMNSTLTLGTRIVVLALVAYSIAILTEQKKHKITTFIVSFLTAGVFLDIIATVFMILGSPNSPFTVHGFLGYSALGAMLLDAVLVWKFKQTHSKDDTVPKGLHLYSRYAYIWWIIAFLTGSLLVILK